MVGLGGNVNKNVRGKNSSRRLQKLARVEKKATVGNWAIEVELAAEQGGQSNTKPSIWDKTIEKKEKKQGWFHLIWARWRAVCSRWSYPIQTSVALFQGGRAVLPEGSPVAHGEGDAGRSLVCIDDVLGLAVVSAALQKLHKCVTQNTTELWNMLTH